MKKRVVLFVLLVAFLAVGVFAQTATNKEKTVMVSVKSGGSTTYFEVENLTNEVQSVTIEYTSISPLAVARGEVATPRYAQVAIKGQKGAKETIRLSSSTGASKPSIKILSVTNTY